MSEKQFVKGDCNQNHCELYYGDEHFGDVRTSDADKFIRLLNRLCTENDELEFDKHQFHIAMDKERSKYVLLKDKVFYEIDSMISQYNLECDNAKLNDDRNRVNDSYIKASALRLLRAELVRWI